MAHEDEKPQEPNIRERYMEQAERILIASANMDATYMPLFIERARVYVELAKLAPPTQTPTPPTQDGAALALLVAFVTEIESLIFLFGEGDNTENLLEIYHKAQTYVRTQAAKGEAGK